MYKPYLPGFLFCFAVAGICCIDAIAGFIDKPNDNTLWMEDGKNIQTALTSSAGKWNSGKTEMKESPESGFTVTSEQNSAIGRYVPMNSEYPWMVFEITEAIRKGTGYVGFSCSGYMNMVNQIQTGIFAFKQPLAEKETGKSPFLRFDISGMELTFKYVKMVKVPEDYIVIDSPAFKTKGYVQIGDQLSFKVFLSSSAEDVSVQFWDYVTTRGVYVNGSASLQLKPDSPDRKTWTGMLKIESASAQGNNTGLIPPGNFLVKAIVLGGGSGVPIWTCNANEFRILKRETE